MFCYKSFNMRDGFIRERRREDSGSKGFLGRRRLGFSG